MPLSDTVSPSPSPTPRSSIDRTCPACGAANPTPFYNVPNVPVHSVLRLATRTEALALPTGSIRLALCTTCGFIYNEAFDETRMAYSAAYDGTQSFSPTFNAFHEQLAGDLIRRYDLQNKTIVEIGCGNGEFLALLCTMGNNRGVGYDPAYSGPLTPADGLTFVPDVYPETQAADPVDFVCCKMTLEHIAQPADFLATIRRGLGHRPQTTVFFQVPDLTRILHEGAFWDIYHEHCSYFSAASLTHLFERQGFEVERTWTAYDDQYLMIEARPHASDSVRPATAPDTAPLVEAVRHFTTQVATFRSTWRQALQALHAQSQSVVLWGGGSKAVAFLTTLGLRDEIRCAVDINPNKHDTFLAGTGHRIIGPDALPAYKPDVVIVMNAIYRDEIGRALAAHHLAPLMLTTHDDPSHHTSALSDF